MKKNLSPVRLVIVMISLIFVIDNAQATTYTLTPGGTITNLAHWGDITTSTAPANFTSGDTWLFDNNNASLTLSTAWGLDAAAIVILGDGTASFTLTYSGTADIGATPANITVSNNAVLILNREYNFNNTKTTFNTGSTVVYSAGTTTVASDDYDQLTIDEDVSTNGAVLTTNGVLTINSSKTLNFDNSTNLTMLGGSAMTGSFSCDNTGTLTVDVTPVTLVTTTGASSISDLVLKTHFYLENLTVLNSFSLVSGICDISISYLELDGNIFFSPTSVFNGSETSTLVIGGSGSITNGIRMRALTANSQSLSELILNRNGATLTLDAVLRISGLLTVSDGTVSAGNNLVLRSNFFRKGGIGIVGATGAFTGTPTVEVYKSAGVTGWVNLCSAGVNGATIADWNTSFAITCPACPNGSVINSVPFTSIYSYDETATTGSASAAAHYIGINSSTDGIDSKTGYWVYLGNNVPNTSAIVISLTGAVNTNSSSGNIVLSLSAGANTEDGWNLIANPYPAPILVSNFITSAGGSNIDNTLLVYDPDTDSNIPFTAAGTNDIIPMGQAFMVRALTNPVTITPVETWKVSTPSNVGIERISGAGPTGSNGKKYYFNDFMLDLTSSTVAKNFFTQAYFSFETGSTNGFDNGKDAYSMESSVDPGTPRIISISNNENWLRNVLPFANGVINIPVLVATGYPGVYSIKPVNLNKLPAGACVQLVDLLNNTTHDLKNGAYTATIAANQTNPQFELKITLNQVSLSQQVSDPLCKYGHDGKILAMGTGAGPWNYTWKDANMNVMRVKSNSVVQDTLSQLFEGIYQVDVNTVGTCNNAHADFVLNAITPLPQAQFTVSSTNVQANHEVPVSFTNLSTNATEFTWDMGNGVTVSNLHATMLYPEAGIYKVKLTASNGTCGDVSNSSLMLTVGPNPVGLSAHTFDGNALFASKDEMGLFVQMNFNESTELEISANNILGQVLVKKTKVTAGSQTKFYLNVPENEKVIFVSVYSVDKAKTIKVIN